MLEWQRFLSAETSLGNSWGRTSWGWVTGKHGEAGTIAQEGRRALVKAVAAASVVSKVLGGLASAFSFTGNLGLWLREVVFPLGLARSAGARGGAGQGGDERGGLAVGGRSVRASGLPCRTF